ncbi:MAG: PepSY-like domain-containing protein [Bacteroidaceae bacterium]|nr:PepSY-like domain-containing protein [Bacteroidaceae bacterium]
MKNILPAALVAVALLTSVATSCRATATAPDSLPQAARTVISKHFSGKQAVFVKQETEWTRRFYIVVLDDGSKIEFDSRGEWTEIDCATGSVPDALVPAPILAYVRKHFPQCVITEIERDARGYEVDLSNGVDIDFDRHFRVREIDR